MVGGPDNNRIIGQAIVLQLAEQFANRLIHGKNIVVVLSNIPPNSGMVGVVGWH